MPEKNEHDSTLGTEVKQSTPETEKSKDFWSGWKQVGYGRKYGKGGGFPVFAGEWSKTEHNYAQNFARQSSLNYGQNKAIIIEGGKTTIAIPHLENEPGTTRKEHVVDGVVHDQMSNEAHLGSLAQVLIAQDNPVEILERAKENHEKRKMGRLDQLQTAFDPEQTSDGIKHFRQCFWRALDQLNDGLSNKLEITVGSASDASLLNIFEMLQDANSTVLIIPSQRDTIINTKPLPELADLLIVAKTDLSIESFSDDPQSALGKWFKKTLEQPNGLANLKKRLQEIPNRRTPLIERLSAAYPKDAALRPLREKLVAKEEQRKVGIEFDEKRYRLSTLIKEYKELVAQFEKNKGVFSVLFSGTTREMNKQVKEFVLPDENTLRNISEVDAAHCSVRDMISLLKNRK